MTIAETAAVVAATTGATSIAWLIRNWLRDRSDVRVTAGIIYAQQEGRFPVKVPMLEVTIANHGLRAAQVLRLGVVSPSGERVYWEGSELPKKLAEEEHISIRRPLDQVDPDLKGVFAKGLKRTWDLSQPEFLKLLSDVRRIAGGLNSERRKLSQAQAEERKRLGQ